MNAAEYTDMLKVRLPPGEAFPTNDQTDGETAWDGLLNALGVEPSRIDDDAELILNKTIPDNDETDLAMWEEIVGAPTEDLTDEERLARIRGILRAVGDVSVPGLEAVAEQLTGDTGTTVLNRARPNFVAGGSNAGDACGDHSFEWGVEMFANSATDAPDDVWTGSVGTATMTAGAAQSPVTLDTDALSIVFGASGLSTFRSAEFAAGDGYGARISIWLRGAAEFTLSVGVQGRNGSVYSGTVEVPTEWYKFELDIDDIGTGVDTPYLVLGAASQTLYVADWRACERKLELERNMRTYFPLHTRGAFYVQDELTPLLAQDPLEVTY